MPYLRWLYRSWSSFLTFVGVLIATVAILAGTVFGLLQINSVQTLLAEKAEDRFSENFSGVLSIGSVEGLLPFNIILNEISIYPDSSTYESVTDIESLSLSLDLLALLNNRVRISGLRLESPDIIFNQKEGPGITDAFRPAKKSSTIDSLAVSESATGSFPDILVPSVVINDGVIHSNYDYSSIEALSYKGDSLTIIIDHLNTYFEYSSEQRIIDLEDLTFRIPELDLNSAQIYGQLYNDNETLELNSFSVNLAGSRLLLNAEANGVDLMKGNLSQQLNEAEYDLSMREAVIMPANLNKIFPAFPALDRSIYSSIKGSGTLDLFSFDNIEFTVGESFFLASGSISDILDMQKIGFDFSVDDAKFEAVDIASVNLPIDSIQVEALSKLNINGSISGNRDSLNGDLSLLSDRGSLILTGSTKLNPFKDMDFTLQADSLNIGGLFTQNISSSDLNLDLIVNATEPDLKTGRGIVNLGSSGTINNTRFDSLSINTEMDQGLVESKLKLLLYGSELDGSASADFREPEYQYTFKGNARNLAVKEIFGIQKMEEAYVDLEYDLSLSGNKVDQLRGQTSLDVERAIIAGDTIGKHQLYFDFTEPVQNDRSLRFTSTAFDATIEGNYSPTELFSLYGHWKQFFKYRYTEEIVLDDPGFELRDTLNVGDQNLEWSARLKNLDLIRSYIPSFPEITSLARLTGTASGDDRQIIFSSEFFDPSFRLNEIKADSIVAKVFGNFRFNNKLKEFSSLEIEAALGLFEYDLFSAKGFDFNADLNKDSLSITTDINRLADRAVFSLDGKGFLTDSTISLRLSNFNVGTSDYSWIAEGDPVATYDKSDKLNLSDFRFSSQDQFISVNGTYSPEISDSVDYIISGLELSRLSDVINGRINFSGLFNGSFTTRSLTQIPSIQGNITVDRFMLDNQIAGDIVLNSTYDQESSQFDTKISVKTDRDKYPEYFSDNDRRGLDFVIDGYVKAPTEEVPVSSIDSLYAFDVELNSIDMWVLPYIGPKIFTEAAGNSSGSGKFWGTSTSYDFDVDFELGMTDAVYFRPEFLDTYYYAQGPINFTRSKGLLFEDIFIIDPTGGLATLSGSFDFNDFQDVSFIDIRLEMDEFQFLNSEFEPTLPFYGDAYGTGVVTITGTNLAPVLRTESQIQISEFSEIGIPLLEETEVSEDNKSIRFVDSFDLDDTTSTGNRNFAGLDDIDPQTLTFAERFSLDLQFVSEDPMTVRLIFDPVTNDAVTANGTGRIRILLEDQEVSMFGRFDITDGRYQFVSGDIFSRRFELEPGGSIIWEGAPDNARLNLNAYYRARPDINTLTNLRTDIQSTNANRVRIPVELVLAISGSLSSIENNFFFRLPNTFDTNTNSTLQTQIAALNRNEDEKLIQATSFLLMGDFIPVSNNGASSNSSFGNNFSGSAAVLNPLLSSQVISPLLSSQINSLLNSDVSSLDVDFNLNTYNQVDLGVALRLYNDKLILRREGQVYAENNINLGDIGATYRINRIFSVTAFHRQDPTFGNLNTSNTRNDTQDINGVGVEARFLFNTWKQFLNRIGSPFRKLFGIKDKEKKQEDITDNREENPS